MRGFFVTGTDTGVGKTFVTAAIARRARSLGRKVFAFKPIETGCRGELGDDQAELCAAAGSWQEGELRGLYRLSRPVAPAVAAREAGIDIEIDRIAELARTPADLTLVEGAGGWRVPISATADISDLAVRLGLPVLVVARAGLGTINHSLLTVEASNAAALILSVRPDDDLAFAHSNAEEIGRRWPGRIVVFQRDPSVLDPFT